MCVLCIYGGFKRNILDIVFNDAFCLPFGRISVCFEIEMQSSQVLLLGNYSRY